MSTLTIQKGTEANIGWRFKIDASTAKNLTGFNVLVQIRPSKDSSTVLGSWDDSSDELTFIPASGSVDLNLPPSATSAFSFKKGVIDCWVYDGLIDTDGDRSEVTTIVIDGGVSRL